MMNFPTFGGPFSGIHQIAAKFSHDSTTITPQFSTGGPTIINNNNINNGNMGQDHHTHSGNNRYSGINTTNQFNQNHSSVNPPTMQYPQNATTSLSYTTTLQSSIPSSSITSTTSAMSTTTSGMHHQHHNHPSSQNNNHYNHISFINNTEHKHTSTLTKSKIERDRCNDALINQQLIQNVNQSWQSLTGTPSTNHATNTNTVDYSSHLLSATLPISLQHFLKYSETIKKENNINSTSSSSSSSSNAIPSSIHMNTAGNSINLGNLNTVHLIDGHPIGGNNGTNSNNNIDINCNVGTSSSSLTTTSSAAGISTSTAGCFNVKNEFLGSLKNGIGTNLNLQAALGGIQNMALVGGAGNSMNTSIPNSGQHINGSNFNMGHGMGNNGCIGSVIGNVITGNLMNGNFNHFLDTTNQLHHDSLISSLSSAVAAATVSTTSTSTSTMTGGNTLGLGSIHNQFISSMTTPQLQTTNALTGSSGLMNATAVTGTATATTTVTIKTASGITTKRKRNVAGTGGKRKRRKPPKEKKPRPKPGEIREVKALDGSTIYCCPECQMAYPDRSLIEQHIISHAVERRFVCDVCNAALKRKDHLTRHKLSHIPDRPHSCNICLKSFKRKEQLTLHIVIHSGQKKHVCPECQKGFYRKDHLRKHTRSHIARRVKSEVTSQNSNNNNQQQIGIGIKPS